MKQMDLFTQTHHNTVPLQGNELNDRKRDANIQQEAILKLYRQYKILSPWQVEGILNKNGKRWPITSIRRAITNLATDGYLNKTGNKRVGVFGMKENMWEIIK